ncbi:MAG: outer membrane beta-barrel domain-containing protein [Gammaproteobacteria bacterium]|nr:outer membrane beta-barrel domain-containing protein [Gammaproteobacteria bacterium]
MQILNASAQSEDEELPEGESVYVIQNKLFHKEHELGFNVGYIPDDDFREVYPVGGNYVYHFSETSAWEVIRLDLVVDSEKSITDTLETEFDVTPEQFDRMIFQLHTSYIIKPSYGKDAIFNNSIINHESYISAGFGITGFEVEKSFGEDENDIFPSASIAYGRRYFIDEDFSLKLEIRNNLIFKDNEVPNNIYLGVSLSYQFNIGKEENRNKKNKKSVYDYLRGEE